MKRNGRLSLALHVLAHMAEAPDQTLTSAEIAKHIGTNAVVVRRVLGSLKGAGLLTSEKGHAGGWSLAVDPKEVTLANVYLALDEHLIIHSDVKINSKCMVEHNLHKKVSDILSELEEDLIKKLADIPISKISES